MCQYRPDVPRLNHAMALEDIKTAQYYLQLAEKEIHKAMEGDKIAPPPIKEKPNDE